MTSPNVIAPKSRRFEWIQLMTAHAHPKAAIGKRCFPVLLKRNRPIHETMAYVGMRKVANGSSIVPDVFLRNRINNRCGNFSGNSLLWFADLTSAFAAMLADEHARRVRCEQPTQANMF